MGDAAAGGRPFMTVGQAVRRLTGELAESARWCSSRQQTSHSTRGVRKEDGDDPDDGAPRDSQMRSRPRARVEPEHMVRLGRHAGLGVFCHGTASGLSFRRLARTGR